MLGAPLQCGGTALGDAWPKGVQVTTSPDDAETANPEPAEDRSVGRLRACHAGATILVMLTLTAFSVPLMVAYIEPGNGWLEWLASSFTAIGYGLLATVFLTVLVFLAVFAGVVIGRGRGTAEPGPPE